MQWTILSPTEESSLLDRGSLGPNIESWERNDRIRELHQGPDSSSNLTNHDAVPEITMLLVILCLICGLFSGAFTVALLFRRIAIALAVTGPLMFSAIWIWWDWSKFRNKQLALGAFAVGFTLTFLALDREP